MAFIDCTFSSGDIEVWQDKLHGIWHVTEGDHTESFKNLELAIQYVINSKRPKKPTLRLVTSEGAEN